MSYTCTHTHTKRQFHSSRGKREGKKERGRETGGDVYAVTRGLSAREAASGCDDIHTSTREDQGISVGLMSVSNAMLCSLVAACPKS